jgi:hypothetical protein
LENGPRINVVFTRRSGRIKMSQAVHYTTEGLADFYRQKKRGEKRTGPALNPLKGSSVRLPHCLYYCILGAKINLFVFNRL